MAEKIMVEISTVVEASPATHQAAVFRVQEAGNISEPAQRLPVSAISAAQWHSDLSKNSPAEWLWMIPTSLSGDSPIQYHPKFLMALLSSIPAKTHNADRESFLSWQFPAIEFETDEWTRRSMTLNGMRMSTEYFASDSPRILQLIEQRLQAGQADVVHDVMVYLMQGVLELRAAMDEERALQADSLAAYLSLDTGRVQELLFRWPLQAAQVTREIKRGFAGTPRKSVNVAPLVENQLERYAATFQQLKIREDRVLRLIDEVVFRLYNYGPADC